MVQIAFLIRMVFVPKTPKHDVQELPVDIYIKAQRPNRWGKSKYRCMSNEYGVGFSKNWNFWRHASVILKNRTQIKPDAWEILQRRRHLRCFAKTSVVREVALSDPCLWEGCRSSRVIAWRSTMDAERSLRRTNSRWPVCLGFLRRYQFTKPF